ncbi:MULTISPECIES: hypothetical protein [unclassified Glutamicibacter]|uniref:hypothetical protein n=1 Tax=unclassified Glutamicibacter TaxID=2627139 RepID=UPI002FC6BCF5
MKFRQILAVIAGVGLAMSSTVVANAQPLNTVVTTDSTITEISVEQLNEHSSLIFPPASDAESPSGLQVANPALLGAIDSFNCNVSRNRGWNVTSYTAKGYSAFAGGKVNLKCGTSSTSGYLHIKSRHAYEWAKRIGSVGGYGRWDDFMDYATRSILKNPAMIRNAGGGKLCYSAPIVLTNAKRTKKVTFNPTVVISKTNKLVITSYPSSKPACR